MSMQKCPVCGDRKPKRSCPALRQTICTVCCATKRQVEIRCPADCVYLASSKSHPAAVVQRRHDRDLGFLAPLYANLTGTQGDLLVIFQSLTTKHAQTEVPPLLDVEVAEAAATAAATLETARNGIIYEHQAVSATARRLSAELLRLVAELSAKGGANVPRLERDAAIALRRLEQGARTAAGALEGDEPPVFLRLLARVLPESGAEQAPPAPSLIVQP